MIKLHGVVFIFVLKDKTEVLRPDLGLEDRVLVNIPAK